MKRIFLTGICLLLLLSCPALAKDIYVTDSLKTSLRISPGYNSKIIRMVPASERVNIIEVQKAWTKVQLADGTQGFVMNQALTDEIPNNFKLKVLQKKYDSLVEKYEVLKLEHDATEQANMTLKGSLAATGKGGADLDKEYMKMKNNSSNYIKIKDEYEKMKSILDLKNQETERLNDVVKQKHITWFMCGAGVLLFGIFLGYSLKKKRRHSFLD
ncbi:MAG: TIGR04211 family SH3 domain-containing protein [Desulfobacteraceae bacterium]|jgi:SH3 domain protein